MAQINDYLISHHFDLKSVANDTQYIFFGGGNDIFYAPLSNETLTASGVKDGLATLRATLPGVITWQVSKLVEGGAKNILLMLLMPWHTTPIAQSFSSAQRNVLKEYTQRLNSDIKSNVSTLAQSVNLQVFDTYEYVLKVQDHPADYGLVNVTAPCLENWEIFMEGVAGQEPQICSTPDEYFYWDGQGHPSAKVHELLATEVSRFLNWY